MVNKKYRNPRIKPIYPLYRLNDREFRIGAQLGITAEFGDPDGELWELATLLDGQPLDNVLEKMKKTFPHLSDEDIFGGIELLDKEGFLEEALFEYQAAIVPRYNANINYFSRYIGCEKNRYEIQAKMNESTILLLGLGGGGSNVLTLLAGIGPKKIIIVDYDKVEESNLGRQLLYRESDIGTPKVDAALNTFKQLNSKITIVGYNKKIITENDVLDLIEGVDLVICAIDEPPFEAQRTVNKAIVKAKVPCVFGAMQVSRGRVFTVIPGITGCFDCLHLHYSMQDKQFTQQFIGFRKIHFSPPTIAYAPAMYQLTATIVDEAVRVLTGYAEPKSLGTQYEINCEDHSSFTHPSWKRYENCPTCGNGKLTDWEIFKYYDRT